MLIEFEGLLYRGDDLQEPAEIWDYARKKWVPDPGGRFSRPGREVTEAEAEKLKFDNPDAEHFFWYDDPPWRQPLSQEYTDAMTPEHLKAAIRRREEKLRRERGE